MASSITDPPGVAVFVATWQMEHVSDDELGRIRALLPADERVAAERMSDARLHLCARALVRESLSRVHSAIEPSGWTFDRTPDGKPFVTGPIACELNLAHTDGFVVCAVGDTPVGVDAEPLARGPAILETVLRAFAPVEVAAVRALPMEAQSARAVELWTVKEAYLKAIGTGIARHLDRFVVEHGADGWVVPEAREWRVRTRVVAGRWMVAVAVAVGAETMYASHGA